MKKIFCIPVIAGLTVAVLLTLGNKGFGQSNSTENDDQKLTATILHVDSLFWKTYNDCDTAKNGLYFTDDVMFYHDKGGITNGKADLVASLKNNICNNKNQRIRREAVPGTVKVYPLRNGDAIYGAVISGEHYFYVTETNKPERREGVAKFNQVWLLKNNEWKMSYVLSYDHKGAPYENNKVEIKLPKTALQAFEGNYKNPKFGTFNIKAAETNLLMDGTGFKTTIYPETPNLFFTKERALQFEFVRNDKNKVFKIVVHENGTVVDELLKF